MKKTLTFISLVFLYGCGGSSNTSGEGGATVPHERVMEVGEVYDVYKGDHIIKTSDNATVSIQHTEGSIPVTSVKLISGSATIIHQ